MRPTFFIVGAPKSGTSALAVYLQDHPMVCFSKDKEPQYFALDLPGERLATDEAQYLNFFHPSETHRVAGEASVFYLYSKVAIQNISDFDRSAKLIVMLRNPIDMVHSFHAQLVFSGQEDQKDFGQAWRLTPQRHNGIAIPRRCLARELLYYDEVGRLGSQLERVFKHFPRDQVHIIFFEAFASNTAAEYRKVLRFLGLPDDGRSDFPKLNANKRHRSELTHDLLYRRAPLLRTPVAAMKRLLGIKEFGILARLVEWEKVTEQRAPLSAELISELADVYESDVRLLEALTGHRLGHWIAPQPHQVSRADSRFQCGASQTETPDM